MPRVNGNWPMPQVGAILRYIGPVEDGVIPQQELRGSDKFFLAGGASLVGKNKVLSIWHVVKRGPCLAIFLPWIGLIPLKWPPERQTKRWEDSLALIDLEKPVASFPPLAFQWPFLTATGYAWIGGYGRWHESTHSAGHYGLQRVVHVKTIRPDHKLDLAWRPEDNKNINAGPFNSGGPMMWRKGRNYMVVAVNRSGFGPRVRASRIARTRWWWLRWRVGWPKSLPMFPGPPSLYQHHRLHLTNSGPVRVLELAMPPGTQSARVTLHSTTRHSHYGPLGPLQMRLSVDPNENLEAAVDTDMQNFGSFLMRSISNLENQEVLRIGVGPFRPRPWAYAAGPCIADVCVRFNPTSEDAPPPTR